MIRDCEKTPFFHSLFHHYKGIEGTGIAGIGVKA